MGHVFLEFQWLLGIEPDFGQGLLNRLGDNAPDVSFGHNPISQIFLNKMIS
jgi:hypothetical protein